MQEKLVGEYAATHDLNTRTLGWYQLEFLQSFFFQLDLKEIFFKKISLLDKLARPC